MWGIHHTPPGNVFCNGVNYYTERTCGHVIYRSLGLFYATARWGVSLRLRMSPSTEAARQEVFPELAWMFVPTILDLRFTIAREVMAYSPLHNDYRLQLLPIFARGVGTRYTEY